MKQYCFLYHQHHFILVVTVFVVRIFVFGYHFFVVVLINNHCSSSNNRTTNTTTTMTKNQTFAYCWCSTRIDETNFLDKIMDYVLHRKCAPVSNMLDCRIDISSLIHRTCHCKWRNCQNFLEQTTEKDVVMMTARRLLLLLWS